MYGSISVCFLRLNGSKDMLLIHEGKLKEEEQNNKNIFNIILEQLNSE